MVHIVISGNIRIGFSKLEIPFHWKAIYRSEGALRQGKGQKGKEAISYTFLCNGGRRRQLRVLWIRMAPKP